MSFPRKEQRNECYAARDDYWNCLDKNQDKIVKETTDSCAQLKDMFENKCPAQWVTHFVRKYKYLKFKEKIDSGYEPVDESSPK